MSAPSLMMDVVATLAGGERGQAVDAESVLRGLCARVHTKEQDRLGPRADDIRPTLYLRSLDPSSMRLHFAIPGALLLTVAPLRSSAAQATARDSVLATVQRVFDAMRGGDTVRLPQAFDSTATWKITSFAWSIRTTDCTRKD
jgi:hypothetical protein